MSDDGLRDTLNLVQVRAVRYKAERDEARKREAEFAHALKNARDGWVKEASELREKLVEARNAIADVVTWWSTVDRPGGPIKEFNIDLLRRIAGP